MDIDTEKSGGETTLCSFWGEDTAYQDLLEYEFSSRDGNEEDDEDTDSEEQLEERKTAQSWLTSACGDEFISYHWIYEDRDCEYLVVNKVGYQCATRYCERKNGL
ncbi:hypothetical protein PInf_015975 [Phytophthora infestans]|nr:hypothetical protein PInf_015975 [Phytophthora infestans]